MINGHIRRNWDERKTIWDKADELEKMQNAELDTLYADDSISDDEIDALDDKIHKKYAEIWTLRSRAQWLEYPQARNSWFTDFVKSFGLVKNKQISQKQADVFEKYSEKAHWHEYGRGTRYRVRVGNLCIETLRFTRNEPCYLTITEI